MPTYEYKCDACGNEFEKFQTMSSEPVKKCPKCGKNKARRLISAGAGLIFKGSGFYITDYRDKGYAEKAKADSAPSEKSSESKPSESGSSDSSRPAASESKPAEAKAEKPASNEPAAKSEPKAAAKASTSAKKK